MYEVISEKDVQLVYGLYLTENDIKEQFPYELGTIESLHEYGLITM